MPANRTVTGSRSANRAEFQFIFVSSSTSRGRSCAVKAPNRLAETAPAFRACGTAKCYGCATNTTLLTSCTRPALTESPTVTRQVPGPGSVR